MSTRVSEDEPARGGTTLAPGDPRSRHGCGRFEGTGEGPLVVIVAGMHGNEPAGTTALDAVAAALAGGSIEVRGTIVALRGNVEACARGERLVDFDLNRLWTRPRLERMREIPIDDCVGSEERELWGLLRDVDRLLTEAPARSKSTGSPIFIDLHTASAASVPFAIGRNTLDHASLFRGLPIPIIAGLEERLDGLLLHYVLEQGARTLAVETGPHEGESAATELEAVVWWLLERSGAIARGSAPGGAEKFAMLERLGAGIPPIVEVFHRHDIVARDQFDMEPDFRSFDRVEANRLLAIDHGRSVRAPRRCRILMPLYQEQGDDGFFLGLDRDRKYLFLSEWFRRMRLEWTLGLFPSVRREPGFADLWRVDRSDRAWVREALRFFGYRDQVELRSGAILASRIRR